MTQRMVSGLKEETIRILVSERELLDHAISIINTRQRLHGYFLSADGAKVMEDEEHYHGSISERVVRTATPEDIEAISVREYLRKLV